MSNQKTSMAAFLQDARTLIENAVAAPELAAPLAVFGYDAARLAEGRAIWAEADALAKRQTAGYAGQHGATQSCEESWAAANTAYMKTLKVSRVAFADDAAAVAALKLGGPRKQSLAGWVYQATTFYDNLAADARLVRGLARFGYSRAKLEAEGRLVDKLRLEAQAQVQQTGGAQASTAARDAKMRELDAWVSDFRTICRVALYESPQELEKLGVMVLNGPRRAAAKAQWAAAKAAAT